MFLSSKVQFLLDATLGLVSIEQNDILKFFSVMSAIFLPPTLVGSIYGMNFERDARAQMGLRLSARARDDDRRRSAAVPVLPLEALALKRSRGERGPCLHPRSVRVPAQSEAVRHALGVVGLAASRRALAAAVEERGRAVDQAADAGTDHLADQEHVLGMARRLQSQDRPERQLVESLDDLLEDRASVVRQRVVGRDRGAGPAQR